MLLLLAIPVIVLVSFAHSLVRVLAPSNILGGRVRASRPAFRSGAALFVLAALLVCIAHVATLAIRSGAPGWLNLLVLVLLWDAIKFALLAAHTTARRLLAPTSSRLSQTPAAFS